MLTFLVTELNFLQRIFDTVPLTSSQWGICLLGPIVYLAIAELVKAFDRRSGARPGRRRPRRDVGDGMSVRGAAFIGIGSMVGAGIFALLGEAAVIAGSAVWLSFLLAGLVTMLLAYNVVKLGIRYPSEGGLIEYLRQGFGNGRLLGIASWLGYAAAFVVVAAMLAVSFGSYATTLFFGDDAWSGWDNVFASLLIVVMTLVNMVGATFVSRVASADGRRPARRLRRLHRGDDLGRQLRPPRLQRLPVVLEDRRQHRADVLRVPRLRRDDVHGRRASATPRASCRERWRSRWG